jgi:2-polyprenyl-3-methyl-5-hydroxy-6-metoxy-1,4-benzoquinol methylase
MKKDNMPQVAQFWNDIAQDFDSIYTGKKSPIGRALDRWLRADMFGRFDWVMEASGDLRGKTVCDIGCGSGRFVTALAQKGAKHVTGVDVAPEMIRLARDLVTKDGVAQVCDFVHADVLRWNTSLQFDEVIAIGLWDYIADPPDRLQVIRKLTKEKFLSAWPRYWTWRMPVRKVRLTAKGCPVYFFRRAQVEKYLHDAHFEVLRCRTIGQLYCFEARPV